MVRTGGPQKNLTPTTIVMYDICSGYPSKGGCCPGPVPQNEGDAATGYLISLKILNVGK